MAANTAEACVSANVAKAVEGLKGKHAIYLVAEGPADEPLFDLHGIAFSKNGNKLERPVPPTIEITVDGKAVEMPAHPVRFNHQNGFVYPDHYQVNMEIPHAAKVEARAVGQNADKVKIEVIRSVERKAYVKAVYEGKMKLYTLSAEKDEPQRHGRGKK